MNDVIVFVIVANGGALALVMFLMWFRSRLRLRITIKKEKSGE